VAAVNNEGELPLDITEDEAMEEMLQEELNRQGEHKQFSDLGIS